MRRHKLHAALDAMPDPGSLPRLQSSTSKRIAHGNVAWSVPPAHQRLIQPQDGAADLSKVTVPIDAAGEPNGRMVRFPSREPEDAGMTGGTRSLMRRVMGLNVTARPGTRKPAASMATNVPAAQIA